MKTLGTIKILFLLILNSILLNCQFDRSPKLIALFSLLSLQSSDVTTTSTTAIYTIGGTLSQLGASKTVVLQNNGGDNLSLTANGSFTFTTSLANSANYLVTVSSQPTNQTCVVSNASGTIASASITNVSLICTGNANGALSSGTIINALSALTGGVTTFVGAPCAANTAGCSSSNGYVDSAISSSARFDGAEGVTTDGYNLYIADKGNRRIRKVVIATGETTTLAGDGVKALLDGAGTAAEFDDPKNLTTDGVNIYVADKNNRAIRKINIATSVVTTIISGSTSLQDPKGMVIYGNYLFVGDNNTDGIIQIDLNTNTISTVVASGLNDPEDMTLVGTDIYIADKNTDTIKKTTIGTWTVSTFAGTGSNGFTDGTGTSAAFRNPEGITNDGVNLYVADTGNHAIRKIVIATAVVTTLAGTNTASYANSSTSTNARFDSPKGITSDGANLYVIDKNNNAIRMIQ